MLRRTLLCTAAALLAAPAFAQDDGEPVKVGFVFVGPIGDGGWTYEHNQARLAVEEHFGDQVETVYQESVPEGADSERVMTQMALSGADLIFTTSFGYMDPTMNVAAKFPDVMFEHAPLENLARDGQLMAYRHEGFWSAMDTLRDKHVLQKLWDTGDRPWARWEQ